jgi:hypothetical protein
MFPTMEVRWFSAGAIPATVQAWFQLRAGQPEEQPYRVDHYLRPADGESLGIKLREGRLEVKKRRRELGVFCFHERIAGRVEHWHKWSFAFAPDVSSLTRPSWIGVGKERRLYRYQLTGDHQLKAISTPDYTRPGCDLELTSVSIADQAWWSLGLEAHGDERSIQDMLFLVAPQVFTAGQPPALQASDSYGYPRWLSLVEKGEPT